jgi:hypothetical protein
VLSSCGSSVHLPHIKRTISLIMGSEHDRVGNVVYCAFVHKVSFTAGGDRKGIE